MPEGLPTLPDIAPPGVQPDGIIIELGFFARFWWLLRRAFVAAQEDNCFSIAKGAAYSSLLSIFPLLTSLTFLLFEANAQAVVQIIATFARQVVPPGAEQLVVARLSNNKDGPIPLTVAAIVISFWAGSGAMVTLMEGFQAAYRIPAGRPFIQQRAMALFLVLIVAFPAIAASSLILFGNRIELALVHGIDARELSLPVEWAWQIGRYALAFATTTLVTGLLYYFGPNYRPEPFRLRHGVKSRFMRVWPGALLATTLWLLATGGFALYVHRANYNRYYGSLGTVVVLLIWLYLVSCIALIGCEFNAERERADSLPTTF